MDSILIVDDEPHIRVLLATILERAGHLCRTAENVAQARQALMEKPFDLLLSDLEMPGESGVDLIQYTKERYPEMAVVIASVLDDPEQVKEVLKLGIYGYIVKPFTSNLVLITIENALRRHRLELEAQLHTRMLEREVAARTQSLDEQLHLLQTLLDAIPVPIYYKNTDHVYLGCNRAYERIFKRQRESIIGKTGFDIHSPQFAADVHQKDEEIFQAGGTQIYEQAQRRADGSELVSVLHKAVFTDSQGVLAGLVGVGLDISEQKRTEQSLRLSEEKLRSIMDNLHIGVLMISPDMEILQINKQMQNWFPQFTAESADINFLDFIRQPGQQEGIAAFSAEGLFEQGKRQEVLATLATSENERIFKIIVSPIAGETGEITAAVGLFEDITDKLVMERELNQAQKLESIGQLAAGIAHEINTPVQYVGDNIHFLGNGFRDLEEIFKQYELLLHAVKNGQPVADVIPELEAAIDLADLPFLFGEIPKTIEQSIDGINRVGAIVRAMKEFSHPGSEEKIQVDINHTLENTLMVSRNEWKYVAEVEADFTPDLPLLSCLAGEINQVFLNLIVNAAHAIGEVTDGGKHGKGLIKLSTRIRDPWIEIRIADTGGGIPESVRHRIFDPFFTTKKIGKGTGQGLTIARNVVVNKHQGKLYFETEAGKGTTFVVQLPVK